MKPFLLPEQQEFSTRDLYLAATLITLRFPLIKTNLQIEGQKAYPVGYFCFENTSNLRDAREKYLQGLLMVEPRLYITNLHSLKSYVHNIFKAPDQKLFVDKGPKT